MAFAQASRVNQKDQIELKTLLETAMNQLQAKANLTQEPEANVAYYLRNAIAELGKVNQ